MPGELEDFDDCLFQSVMIRPTCRHRTHQGLGYSFSIRLILLRAILSAEMDVMLLLGRRSGAGHDRHIWLIDFI